MPFVLLVLMLAGCEKETVRAARGEFQSLMSRNLPANEQARALEAFVGRFPESKTNPYLTRAESLLADYHARAGRIDIAASWYERAVRASPGDPDLLNALGYLYASHGINLDRAVSVLETAARAAEERGFAPRRQGLIKDSLGWAHRMRGDLGLAVAILEEACRLAPDVSILRLHLADAYRAIGEREKAAAIDVDLYLGTRATDPTLREALDQIGREGGTALSRQITRRVREGLKAIAQADRREAEAEGATLVELKTSAGEPLAGSLFLPVTAGARPGSPQPRCGAVLLLHALASSRRAAAPLARLLAGRGLLALTIDLRGHGGSISESLPGPRQFRERMADNLAGAERDARAALGYLVAQQGVDARRLGLVGAGVGALLAARIAGDPGSRPISALAILSPWGRADAYQPYFGRLATTGSVFLVSSTEEASTSSTIESLAASLGPGAVEKIGLAAPGSGFDLLERDSRLGDRLASFFADRLR